MNELEELPVPSPENGLRRVFIGPEGVRAGWRLVVFLALVVVLALTFGAVQRRLLPNLGKGFSAPTVIVGEVLFFAVVAIAAFVMSRLEHRRFAEYGLPLRGALGRRFWTGALWGFVMLSFIVAMMAASHAYRTGGVALSRGDVFKFGLLWAIAFLMVGLFEEFAFRGYIQFTLTTGMGFWPAAVITCVVFAGLHIANPGENLVGVIEIILIALFLCLALRRTGSLWFAVGWHMAFDWGESFFYSTPNSGIHATGHMLNASLMGSRWLSGGSVGPEASVFDLLVTITGILLLARLYPDAKYPAMIVPLAPRGPSSVAAAGPAETPAGPQQL